MLVRMFPCVATCGGLAVRQTMLLNVRLGLLATTGVLAVAAVVTSPTSTALRGASSGMQASLATAGPQLALPDDTSHCQTLAPGNRAMMPLVTLCRFALTFRRELPDFICEQMTTGTGQGTTKVMNAEVTFEKGHEQYSNVTIDGKAPTDETAAAMKLFSTGELGSDLVDLFRIPLAVEFKFRGEEKLNKHTAWAYEFHIAAEKNTFWSVQDSRGGISYPEYQGELWVERDSGRLLRLRLQPIHLPRNSELISAVITNDYNYIVIADAGRFLLPTTSITAACFHTPVGGDWFCKKNTLVFHDCRRFGTKSRIIPDPSQR
jgi:hypothetical protein